MEAIIAIIAVAAVAYGVYRYIDSKAEKAVGGTVGRPEDGAKAPREDSK